MDSNFQVTLISMDPDSATWQSRVVTMTTAIVLVDELDEPFEEEATREWRALGAPAQGAPRVCRHSV